MKTNLRRWVARIRKRILVLQRRSRRNAERPADLTAIHDQSLPNGFLSHAHDFIMHSPIIAHTQHVHLNMHTWVLKELEKSTIPGAEFDSAARDPPPRCHPGTRVDIINGVQNWLNQPEPSKKLLWVYGPAGVGKSAVLQSIAEMDAELRCLGAALFFSRPFGRDDPTRVWSTIAFQMAVKDIPYRAYVQEEIQNNPNLLKKGMREQFNKLIVLPFGQKQIIGSPRPLSVVLDGLDECEGDDAQSEIIHLISEFARDYPLAPLVWIIASRTEQHLKVAFEHDNVQKGAWRIYIPVDSDDGCRDVEHYLRSEFERIRRKYPWAVPETAYWPKEGEIATLMHASSGLFLYASAILRFVDDPLFGDPISQLELLISIVGRADSSSPGGHMNPLSTIHSLYTQILELIPPASYSVTKRILGFLLLEHGYGSWQPKITSFWALCNVLGIKQNVAYGALHKLHSVLYIPDHQEASSSSMMIFHTSFSDFLADPVASGKFYVSQEETLLDLWQCQFRLLQQTNISDYPFPQPGNIDLAWPSHPLINRTLRNQLWMRARLSFWTTPGQSFGQGSLQLSAPFLNAFSEIDFSKFIDGYELPEARRLPELVDLLTRQLRPELVEAGLLSTINIHNTSFEWIQRESVSFKVKYYGKDIVREAYTDLVFSPGNEPSPSLRLMKRRTIGQLVNELAVARYRISSAVVIGRKTAGRCAILIEEPQDDDFQVFYFVAFTSNTRPARGRGA